MMIKQKNTNQVLVRDWANEHWLRFTNPRHVELIEDIGQVLPALQRIEKIVNQENLTAIGYISYEGSPAFDSVLITHPADDFPLLWFGLYSKSEIIDLPTDDNHAPITLDWQPSVKRPEYDRAIDEIKHQIERGYTYQVNYTMRLRANFNHDPLLLFSRLASAQETEYAAYLDIGRYAICSLSPELFFELDGYRLHTKPMKGTAPRGRTQQEDEAQAAWLSASEKNRAENVMIVDMVRNDLGRVAQIGSVKVPELFVIERYPTVWQMISNVTAKSDAPLVDIMKATFPCASITGAPKASTMRIIRNLEADARRIYTGAIGMIAPGRRARFSVAIRTVLVDREINRAEYGVGGGIVWDSTSEGEYEECLTKARILTESRPVFELLESILWSPDGGYFLLDLHLKRMGESARYFGYPFDLQSIEELLRKTIEGKSPGPHKVRILLAKNGNLTIETEFLPEKHKDQPVRLCLAKSPIHSTNPFLYHKTTHRAVYTNAWRGCEGFDDVILWNERGEVTETTIANLVLQLDGKLITPAGDCGLLPGTMRAHLLSLGEIQEGLVSLFDLRRCECIYVINSVRGMRKAIWTPDRLFHYPSENQP